MLLSILVILFSAIQPAAASWEYAGYSGMNNEIKIYGSEDFLNKPYPITWSGPGEAIETCLCTKETRRELNAALAIAFGKKASAFKNEIISGTKYVLQSKTNKKTPLVEVYGLFVKAGKPVDKAYEEVKRVLGTSKYAIMKTSKGVYFARRSDEMPQRTFLHFVRGYDDGASQ